MLSSLGKGDGTGVAVLVIPPDGRNHSRPDSDPKGRYYYDWGVVAGCHPLGKASPNPSEFAGTPRSEAWSGRGMERDVSVSDRSQHGGRTIMNCRSRPLEERDWLAPLGAGR